jgi:hypothetical protein
VSEELPEGWEQTYERYDGSTVVLDAEDGEHVWLAFLERQGDFPLMVGGYPTAQAAMAALDREYPMEKQHGEK